MLGILVVERKVAGSLIMLLKMGFRPAELFQVVEATVLLLAALWVIGLSETSHPQRALTKP